MKPECPLEQIAATLPPADHTLADAIVGHESRQALVSLGEQIRSCGILDDVGRIYALAHAVWTDAGESQKQALVGFSEELLAIAVDRALALRALVADEPDGPGGSPSDESATAARAVFEKGLVRRDHARHVLRAVAGRNAGLLTRIEKAADAAMDAHSLAGAIQRLAKIGRQFLRSNHDKMRARVKLARLDEAYLARLDDLARELRRSSKAASGAPGALKASQQDIDFLDGVNLVLLSLIVSAFESAHEIDPRIPRLVPVATRRLLGKRGEVIAAGAAPAEQDDGEGEADDGDAGAAGQDG